VNIGRSSVDLKKKTAHRRDADTARALRVSAFPPIPPCLNARLRKSENDT